MTSTFVPAAEYATYVDVPTLRKRWVFVLAVLFFIPAAIAIAVTGDVYALHKGTVVRYPSTQKTWMVVGYSLFLIGQLLSLT